MSSNTIAWKPSRTPGTNPGSSSAFLHRDAVVVLVLDSLVSRALREKHPVHRAADVDRSLRHTHGFFTHLRDCYVTLLHRESQRLRCPAYRAVASVSLRQHLLQIPENM